MLIHNLFNGVEIGSNVGKPGRYGNMLTLEGAHFWPTWAVWADFGMEIGSTLWPIWAARAAIQSECS